MVSHIRAIPRTSKQISSTQVLKVLTYTFLVLLVIFLSYIVVSSLYSSNPDTRSWIFTNKQGEEINTVSEMPKTKTLISDLRDSFSFLPGIDLSSSSSSDDTPASRESLDPDGEEAKGSENSELKELISKLQDSVTFLPLKDLRFAKTAMDGNTWFMSSFTDTYEENEAEHLYFPSQNSNNRLLCIKATAGTDGTNNSYALAWPESLPKSAKLLKGLSFISNAYYDYGNMWHGLSAFAPFVGWSMKNGCAKPARWLFFQQGSPQTKTGAWLQKVMQGTFGEIPIESFQEGSDMPYCFEKALVMRHDFGHMGLTKRNQVYQHIRCKARSFCGVNLEGKGRDLNENGVPIIRLTLLMRRATRAFKDPEAVTEIFRKECAKVEGCILEVAQSEDLSFCDQVRLMTYTDILASTHGAQMTNMIFMDKNSTVMEFFPKGWLELAGVGQYVYHWLAAQSGMKHPGAYWEQLDKKDCPNPQDTTECFNFYKNGLVGHNNTLFTGWARTVLNDVKYDKENKDLNTFAACTVGINCY
ncbi:hypothetical protein Dimus_024989 [Dionaea muscipula]